MYNNPNSKAQQPFGVVPKKKNPYQAPGFGGQQAAPQLQGAQGMYHPQISGGYAPPPGATTGAPQFPTSYQTPATKIKRGGGSGAGNYKYQQPINPLAPPKISGSFPGEGEMGGEMADRYKKWQEGLQRDPWTGQPIGGSEEDYWRFLLGQQYQNQPTNYAHY